MLTALSILTAVATSKSQEVNLFVGRNVAPAAKIRIYLNSKNVRKVPIQVYKLPLEELRHIFDPKTYRPKPQGKPVRNLVIDVAGQKKELAAPQDTYYEKQFNLADLPPGYYYIQAPGYAGNSWATMNVTNLSVIVKRGEKRALTWVTDAKSGRVISGAGVTAFRSGKKTSGAVTDGKGIANLNMPPGNDVLLVQRGNDAAAVTIMGGTRDGTVVSHMQFDRPVYRPGQNGFFKAILRKVKGLGYEPIANQPVTMELLDSQSTLIERHELKTTGIGTVAGEFNLPKEGALGWYTVNIRQGNNQLDVQSFQVAEYRKPEFKVTSAFSQKKYLSGEKIVLNVATEYYFGAKVPGATVQMVVRRSPMRWGVTPYEYEDGNLYARDAYSAGQVVANDVRKTDKDGKVQIEIPTAPDTNDATYQFDLTITDGANRQITHSNSTPVYAAAIRASVNATVGYVPLGRLVPMEVRLSDLDGKPTGGKVALELRQTVWDEKQKRQIEKTLEKTDVSVPASGVTKATLPAKAQGYLSIVAIAFDSGGRKTMARSDIYIADPFSSPDDSSKQPTINVRMERHDYKLGETVNGYVESNRPKRPILLTMEGADLLGYQVLSKPGAFQFKLDQAAAPNMQFSAQQWVDVSLISSNTMIGVLDPSRRLTVDIKPEREELAPGDKAKYQITTKDSNGRPIGAEVAFQVIDEAIYAVQPDNTADLINTFWGSRPIGVATTSSAPEEMSAGAFQAQMAMGKDAPMRTQFVDTAFWNPFVVTGPTGSASVEFDMPGNLTAWRAQARAVTESTQVGEAKAMTRSSRPLTLRIATPRQMVVGDHLDLVGTVTNRTDQDEKVKVRIQVGDKVEEKSIVAPAKGDVKVTIPFDAKNLGTTKIRGELFNGGGTREDGLEVGVPINPNGVPFREVETGRTNGKPFSFILPARRIAGSESVKVRFYPSPAAMIPGMETSLLDRSRYTPIVAAEQIEVAAQQKIPWTDDRIREPIAMLGRTHEDSGWGWWDGAAADPVVTARVLRGLTATKNYPEWESLRNDAREAAKFQYTNVQFAEYRALLVEALATDGEPNAGKWATEVDESTTPISPTAQLALAHALQIVGKKDRAQERLHGLVALVSKGQSSYLPVGRGIGWVGSELEANARLLDLMLDIDPNNDLADSLADWVIERASQYMGPGDTGAVLRALHHYVATKQAPSQIGQLHVKADGVEVPVWRQPDGFWAEAEIPASAANKDITVDGIDRGQSLRYVIEKRAYLSSEAEVSSGVRTLLRWEVMNAAGAWEEINRDIKPNEPVRVSAIVWGDSVTDAVRVIVPIPAGFEYVDQDNLSGARQEVRDGAVNYYVLLANGLPATFRFYIRAETDGSISVPAAMAEALRRADVRGNSNAIKVVVAGG